MLDAELLAQPVEHVCAAGFLLLPAGREAISELAAVVGQQLNDLDGAGLPHLRQQIDAAAAGLVGIQFDVDPTRGAVDGDEQVVARRLVGHLRQVLDIDVHEARLVILESFFVTGVAPSCSTRSRRSETP